MPLSFASDAQASLPLDAPDGRADGQRRQVILSCDTVTIARRLHGIAMQVSVPVKAYRGVCVGLKANRSGGVAYEIKLAHRDEDLSVSLAVAPDDADIWADWRSWAQFFRLPALVERSDRALDDPGRAMDRAGLALKQTVPAKRRSRRRRPGFITRRYTRQGAAAIVYRKAEIIAPD